MTEILIFSFILYIFYSIWESTQHLKYRRRMEMQQNDMEHMLNDIHKHIVISNNN